MAKYRDKVPFEEIYSLIPESWSSIIDNFLSRYEGKSLIQYKSAVAFIIYHTGKHDLSLLNFNDYKSVQAGIKSSQKSYTNAFFQYLYGFDIMRNDDSFNTLWSKEALRKEIETKRNKKIKKEANIETRRARVLSVEDITLLNELANQTHDRELITKYCFIWDMLFYTNCKVTDIQDLDKSHYVDHFVITSNGEKIQTPPKYHAFLDNYLGHSGFTDIGEAVERLGKLVKINELTPRLIKNTRKANILTCSNCGENYMTDVENWTSVNGRVICLNCAEVLKKNSWNKIEAINNTKVIESEQRTISPAAYSFDEQRKKLSTKIDYLKLQKYKKELGDLGEAFVYELECEKLKGSKYLELVDPTKADDPSNGYDILSFTLEGVELHIEVKTTLSNEAFYLTTTELETAKRLIKLGKKYVIYRVENILAKDIKDIKWKIIENIFNSQEYLFEVHLYKVLPRR